MKNKQLLIIAVCLILTGSFLTGIGLQRMISNVKIRNEYRDSQLKWKNELLIGAEEDEVRDMKNQMLAENMKYVSIEREIYVDSSDSEAEARISNGIQSSYSCKIKLLRDATGEIIYESEAQHFIQETGVDCLAVKLNCFAMQLVRSFMNLD